MPAIADLIEQSAVDRLAQLRMRLGRHQDAAAEPARVAPAPAPPPVCASCGQRIPAPAARFSGPS